MTTYGCFITFEGGEGCGKSTQLPLLAQFLREKLPGREIVEARSPGGTPAAERIRRILKERDGSENLLAETELLLFAACHCQMCDHLIRPALSRGAILLSDRFTDSTLVYQGTARRLDPAFIRTLNDFACKGTAPALTLVLDIAPETALPRTRVRAGSDGTAADRFDSESLEFHRAVRAGFLELARREPERFAVIDAAQTPDRVARQIQETVRERLDLF